MSAVSWMIPALDNPRCLNKVIRLSPGNLSTAQ